MTTAVCCMQANAIITCNCGQIWVAHSHVVVVVIWRKFAWQLCKRQTKGKNNNNFFFSFFISLNPLFVCWIYGQIINTQLVRIRKNQQQQQEEYLAKCCCLFVVHLLVICCCWPNRKTTCVSRPQFECHPAANCTHKHTNWPQQMAAYNSALRCPSDLIFSPILFTINHRPSSSDHTKPKITNTHTHIQNCPIGFQNIWHSTNKRAYNNAT